MMLADDGSSPSAWFQIKLLSGQWGYIEWLIMISGFLLMFPLIFLLYIQTDLIMQITSCSLLFHSTVSIL